MTTQDRPSASLTFLFTDIEGSTRRWEHHYDAMSAALNRHDQLLRNAISSYGGRVFKTVGDAFCAAFAHPSDAVAAALTAQRALAAEPWSAFGEDFADLRVRMAIHAGTAEVRDDDYFGPDLNRVARLLAAGHGGQVLVSEVAAGLARGSLSAGLVLRDMGERRLKDLRRPEHVFQLLAPDLPADFAPLSTLDARPNNLPIHLTSLVGRETEVAELARLLRADDGPRLVTLTGPGGTGKTRLALQVAAELVDDFDHGVWFVDLAPLTDSALVAPTIARVLGVDEVPGQPVEDTLRAWLAGRGLLLMLDNFEHVLGAASLVTSLLSAASGVRALVTSREPLRLRGERGFPVGPLALPAADSREPLDVLVQYAALQLFIQRAVDVRPDFAVTNDTAPALAQICIRLDGLPLAIELAAARVDLFELEEMLERLESRLQVLIDGYRDLPPRQQTMRAAIAWSYDLLDPANQRVLERLSLFQGPAPLSAAGPVCGGDGVDPLEVVEDLSSLVEKSLVVAEARNGAPWYRILETVRAYAAEQLAEVGDGDAARARLLAWSVALTDRAHVDQVVDDLEPLRATFLETLRWAVNTPDQSASAVALASRRFWIDLLFGRSRIVRPLLAAALDGAGADADPTDMAWLCYVLATLEGFFGDPDTAIALYQRAADGFIAVGERVGEAWAVQDMGNTYGALGDAERFRMCQEQALALKRAIGVSGFELAIPINNLGEYYRSLGDLTQALAYYVEAVAVQEQEGLTGWHLPLSNLGHTLLLLGDVAGARQRFEQALGLVGMHFERSMILAGLAGVATAYRAPWRAVRLIAAAQRLLDEHLIRLGPVDQAAWDRIVADARQQMTDVAWNVAWADGLAMSGDEIAAYALDAASLPRP